MGTAVRPAKTSPGSWDAFADVDIFVDAVLAELTAMASNGARPQRPEPKPLLSRARLRKAVMAIWCVCFCGMQWRAIGQLCDIPFNTLYGLFARWTRLNFWRRLRRTWRCACGDSPEPSAVVIDSRSCRSAPSCFARGVNGARRFEASRSRSLWRNTVSRWRSMSCRRTIMTQKPSSRFCASSLIVVFRVRRSAISATGANAWPRPVRLSASPSKPSRAVETGSSFLLASAGVVERSFAWISRYRRLNTIFERSKEHLLAFIALAFVSILSRRTRRIIAEEPGA